MSQPGAQDGGVREAGLEFIFGEVNNLLQIKERPVGVKNKLLVGAGRGILLIRTSEQALGAAEEMIADFGH
jgi:hypothetical protein